MKRVEADDANAIYTLGSFYREGINGYPVDHKKALELFHRSGKIGYAGAYCNIGLAYEYGIGVEHDRTKATHYYELAAMGGSAPSRFNLGLDEEEAGNMLDRAIKHHMIAVLSGSSKSLERIKDLYSKGHATKDDYTAALRTYQGYLGEIKSVQRDKAAAACETYRYY